ncbi:cytochrome P450 [Nocardia terpenica]|nr:cytochrome P450 [Nocardia terpenica]NQE93643.1 cytochrome P450 [Nocardia terpenica]
MDTAGQDSIPRVPGAIPGLGHARRMLGDPSRFLSDLPAHGDVVEVRFGPAPVDFVCDPELVRTILLDDATFGRGGVLFDRVREVTGEGLGNCPHSEHRWQRRLLQPTFTATRVAAYAPTMIEQIGTIVDGWGDGQVLAVLAEMSAITSKTLVATLLCGSLPDDVLRMAHHDLQTVTTGVGRRMMIPPLLDRLPTRGKRRYDRARQRLRDTVDAIVADRRNRVGDELISLLLAARHPVSGRPLTDAEISDQVVSFFLAGTETTADTLAWAIHLVATHPEVQNRLHTEVDTYQVHHRPDRYEQPDRAAAIARTSVIPFGSGTRKCIGDDFAITETTLALATIAGRWRLEPIAGDRVRPSRIGMLRPRGLRVRVRSRSSAD